MYGVLFTQSIDNDLVGILLFKKEAKAKMAFRVLSGREELSSLDENVNTVLETSDFEDIPEIEEDDIQEMIQLQVKGKTLCIKIINPEEIPDIE